MKILSTITAEGMEICHIFVLLMPYSYSRFSIPTCPFKVDELNLHPRTESERKSSYVLNSLLHIYTQRSVSDAPKSHVIKV